jgi:phosphatidylglycerophosphate synthase
VSHQYDRAAVVASCPDSEKTPPYERGVADRLHERRTGREVLAEVVFRPLAAGVVRVLLPLRFPPAGVVLANGVAGLAAAAAVAAGDLIAAAVLLQVRTVLDNADGRLARESGRISALGRYLDTETDLVVNVTLFAAVAYVTGSYVLAPVALVALTLVLSADFNEDVLYRRVRGETVVTQPSAAGEGRLAHALAAGYEIVFAPQDRALQTFARRRLARVLARVDDPERQRRATVAYHDGVTATVLANFGLSTQLAALGVLLAVGSPDAYLWLVVACTGLLPLLQLRRERVARRVAAA